MAKTTNGMQSTMATAPKHVTDNNGGTPERVGNDDRAGLIEGCGERCPRQRRLFEASSGERHGLPPSRSVGKCPYSAPS